MSLRSLAIYFFYYYDWITTLCLIRIITPDYGMHFEASEGLLSA